MLNRCLWTTFMKKRCLLLSLLAPVFALAQEEPPTLTFDTDVYIHVPKFTLSIGSRAMTGVKSSFSGTGSFAADTLIGDFPATGAEVTRVYHDGSVRPDTRIRLNPDGTPELGSDGNPVRITPDGKTNSWNFLSDLQALPDGTIAMHSYAGAIQDSGAKSKDADRTYGIEVMVRRDIGKITTRFSWDLGAGLSIGDINTKLSSSETATITTTTDRYSLFGEPAPTAPYAAPSSGTVTNPDGTTTVVDTTVLLGTDPLTRTTSTSSGTATNNWNLKGAYFTLRAGPSLIVPISEHFRASFSAGAALVYAGTTYSVQQNFQPETGSEISSTVESTYSKLLPGYYADASMEYWLTERAGFYVGAIFQSSGDYEQSIATESANYSTRVDLSSLQGFRMGMNIRF